MKYLATGDCWCFSQDGESGRTLCKNPGLPSSLVTGELLRSDQLDADRLSWTRPAVETEEGQGGSCGNVGASDDAMRYCGRSKPRGVKMAVAPLEPGCSPAISLLIASLSILDLFSVASLLRLHFPTGNECWIIALCSLWAWWWTRFPRTPPTPIFIVSVPFLNDLVPFPITFRYIYLYV